MIRDYTLFNIQFKKKKKRNFLRKTKFRFWYFSSVILWGSVPLIVFLASILSPYAQLEGISGMILDQSDSILFSLCKSVNVSMRWITGGGLLIGDRPNQWHFLAQVISRILSYFVLCKVSGFWIHCLSTSLCFLFYF